MKKILVLFIGIFILSACGKDIEGIPKNAIYKHTDYGQLLPVSGNNALKYHFNAAAGSDTVYVKLKQPGLKTYNQEFFESVISPDILRQNGLLSTLSYPEIINELALYTFAVYREYFGESFYRWGGDIFDLDDPQPKGLLVEKRYGLDCSGFTTAPYDLAVYFNLIPDSIALFSSKGYEKYCAETGFVDGGGLDGGPNQYRVDTHELDQLGDLLFRIEKGGSPSQEEINILQAGDIVGRDGHFGIIVIIENVPYYLESGGWVVPVVGGYPVEAGPALTKFAKNGYVSVRRCL